MAIVTRESKGSALTHAEMDNNITELQYSPDGKVFDNAQGHGIKLDTTTPVFGWHDLNGSPSIYGEVGDASRVAYVGNIKVLQFDEGDAAYASFHIPHDHVPGTDLYIHVHWSHNSSVVTGGSVTWGFECVYAKGYDQGAFTTPVLISVVQNASLTQYSHSIAETVASVSGGSAVLLDTDLIEPDGMLECRVLLDSNDITTSDLSVPAPFVHSIDIHYQSTGIPTKNRNSDFWV